MPAALLPVAATERVRSSVLIELHAGEDLGISASCRAWTDGIESVADFREAGPSRLLDHFAVAQEHEGRPKFDLKRPSQWFPFSIFNHDVSNLRVLLEQGRQLRPERAAVGSPLRAEFEENRALHLVDLLPGRLLIPFATRHIGCHVLFLYSARQVRTRSLFISPRDFDYSLQPTTALLLPATAS
jgi:hypothetical protein